MGGMNKACPGVFGAALLLLACAPARAEPAIVSLARAYLGPESTLDSLQSIHYVGSLDRTETGPKALPPSHSTLDMVFVKPLRQRLVVRGANVTFTTVLDGYDAWDLQAPNADPSRFRLRWMPAADIKKLRANTWENLYYYRADEGGAVEDKGGATIDGIACERVDFSHGEGIVYARYFDRDTGRLVLTVRDSDSFRESGEVRVEGIRFPKSIVSVSTGRSGITVTSTATFERITINEPLDPELFARPNLAPGTSAVAQPK